MAKIGLTASSELLEAFSDDVKSLWCPTRTIRILDAPPSSSSFLRDYVSKSVPCIIRNCVSSNAGDALYLTLDDLVDTFCQGDGVSLTVDVTPDGHGDCVRTVDIEGSGPRRMFVTPQQRIMSIDEFRSKLRSSRVSCSNTDNKPLDRDEDGREILTLVDNDSLRKGSEEETLDDSCVFYYSRQMDCLRTELKSFFDQRIFPKSIPFAEEAFGTGGPDAVNLWIGDDRATSSMHKDHYENLFYVLSGEKVFTLCPPASAPFLSQGEFDSGSFSQQKNGKWVVVPDYNDDDKQTPSRVKWVEADVEELLTSGETRVRQRHPLVHLANPIQVHVKQGELLYLPSLWFHRVTQTCETVGINYWYDMKFDTPLWCYFNFLQQLKLQQLDPEQIDAENSRELLSLPRDP